MSKTVKLILTISTIVLAVLLCIGGGAWYWWQKNSAELIESGKAAMSEGRLIGTNVDESGCVSRAFDNHKADWNRSFSSSIKNSLWLSGCLEASKVQEKFCVDVPSQNEIVAVGVWSGVTCSQNGMSDSYCPNLLQNVAKYCSSGQRSEKIRKDKTRTSAT